MFIKILSYIINTFSYFTVSKRRNLTLYPFNGGVMIYHEEEIRGGSYNVNLSSVWEGNLMCARNRICSALFCDL